MDIVYYEDVKRPKTMLFHGKRNKKIINTVWTVIAVLVSVSMVFLYTPLFF